MKLQQCTVNFILKTTPLLIENQPLFSLNTKNSSCLSFSPEFLKSQQASISSQSPDFVHAQRLRLPVDYHVPGGPASALYIIGYVYSRTSILSLASLKLFDSQSSSPPLDVANERKLRMTNKAKAFIFSLKIIIILSKFFLRDFFFQYGISLYQKQAQLKIIFTHFQRQGVNYFLKQSSLIISTLPWGTFQMKDARVLIQSSVGMLPAQNQLLEVILSQNWR